MAECGASARQFRFTPAYEVVKPVFLMAKNPTKELYGQLRLLSCDELWRIEIPRFNRASPKERQERVALVRAVGVVFSESGTEEQKTAVKRWLVGLLQDPAEKIRRYAMAALPKVGAGPAEEAALLEVLSATKNEREKKFLQESLNKVGGAETLQTVGLSAQTQQKVQAAVARQSGATSINMEAVFSSFSGLRLHLRCRKGLEEIVRDELEDLAKKSFRVLDIRPGFVAVAAQAAFSLGDLYALRCFGTLGLVLGFAKQDDVESTARLIASPLSLNILHTFTSGPIRYRLDFIGKGHQRGAIRQLANRVYSLCPDILNDAKVSPWSVDIYPDGSVELRPRLVPDPRFVYRVQDVPAASHPPLAAALVRVAGRIKDEIVWDPFCGSGIELIESALLGRVQKVYGTDLSETAIAISEKNFTAAGLTTIPASFVCTDFRDFVDDLGPQSVSLVITNPPLGRRVPIASIRQLMADLFFAAATVLRPSGRLIFINPLPTKEAHPAFQLQSRRTVDLGGFDCRMEFYRKSA